MSEQPTVAAPRFVRVDMSTGLATVRALPAAYDGLGGRALTSQIVWDEVPPEVDPLGRRNKLVFATGVLAGTGAPSAGRLSVGGKSPLTRGIKESNVGGTAAAALSRLNIRAIVVEGAAEPGRLFALHIAPDGVRLAPCDDLRMLTTYATVRELRRLYPEAASVICIGPAGERLAQVATIAVTEREGWPCRHAARGALGAVAGAKGLKAIVIDRGGARAGRPSDAFRKAAGSLASDIAKSRATLRRFGTVNLLDVTQGMGGLPTRNFSRGTFERADAIGPLALEELIKSRGGRAGVACHPGCPIRCSNVIMDEQGEFLTASLEYETVALMGANLEIADLDKIARLDRICDELGVDTIDSAVALGVAMEGGALPFGDADSAFACLAGGPRSEILRLAEEGGITSVGKHLGCRRIPVVKGQGLAAYDPRVFTGTGLTCATTPMGADHTAGSVLPGRFGYHGVASSADKGEAWLISHDLQALTAALDALGVCFFAGATVANMEAFGELVTLLTGKETTALDLVNAAKRTITLERAYNLAAGLSPKSDALPEFFATEPLTPHGRVFDNRQDIPKLIDLMAKPETKFE